MQNLNIQNQPQNQQQDKMNVQIEKMEQMHITKDNEDPNQDKKFEREIQCKKLEKTILNDKKVNIIIRNPIAKQSTNILKSGYIIYEVYT